MKNSVFKRGLALMSLWGFLCGCGFAGGSSITADNAFDYVEGQWFDINGDTVLRVDRDTITLKFGERYSVDCKYRFKQEGDSLYIKLVNPEFPISYLQIVDDSKIIAFEEILDADGHRYDFVRKDQIEKELAVTDQSRNMPKLIESDVIEELELSFTLGRGRSYELPDYWPHGRYSLRLEKSGDGYSFDFTVMGDSYVAASVKKNVDAGFALQLARFISRQGLPSHNGYYRSNSRSLPGYSLFVSYESGEKLSIRAGGNAADSCIFDLKSLMEYIRSTPQLADDFINHEIAPKADK